MWHFHSLTTAGIYLLKDWVCLYFVVVSLSMFQHISIEMVLFVTVVTYFWVGMILPDPSSIQHCSTTCLIMFKGALVRPSVMDDLFLQLRILLKQDTVLVTGVTSQVFSII